MLKLIRLENIIIYPVPSKYTCIYTAFFSLWIFVLYISVWYCTPGMLQERFTNLRNWFDHNSEKKIKDIKVSKLKEKFTSLFISHLIQN